MMKVGLTRLVCLMLMGTGSLAWAEPWDPSCQEAIGQLRRAQETVQAKQVEVQKAERGERVQLQQAEICKPGGIIIAGRVSECVRLSREFPIVIQQLNQAKADRQPALDRFDEALETLNRRCRERP